MNLRSWAGPTALGVALASVAGGAVYLSRGSGPGVHAGSSGPPPKLRLASARNADMAMGAPSSGSSGYELEGTLSDDKPEDGRVRHPRAGSANAAAELARALGLTGTPTEIQGGWALRGPDKTILILRSSGDWSWDTDCYPDQPIASDDASQECAVAVSSIAPSPPPGPSDDDAIAAARPVLEALGFAGLRITASPANDSTTGATVTPAAGSATSVLVSASKHVVGGYGRLSGSTEGNAYPLISASAAFEELKKQPRMMMDLCMMRKDGKPGCEEPAPTVITGATLGLMLDYEQSVRDEERGGALLVPAWLFTVKGSTETIPWVAVDPAYLEQPSTAPGPGKPEPGASSDPGCPPDSCTGGGTSSSSGQPEPAPASPSPVVQGYTLDGDSTVVGYVELDGCTTGELFAKESSEAVYLVVNTRYTASPGTACSSDTHLETLKVTLMTPLGTRAVRNPDGSEIPRRK